MANRDQEPVEDSSSKYRKYQPGHWGAACCCCWPLQPDLSKQRPGDHNAAELAQHRHTVVSAWAEQGTTGTRRQVTQIDEAYWNSKLPRPDPSAEGGAQHFRCKPALEVSQARAAHMREVVADRRAAAAQAAG
jgi:hypothetical protein